MKILKNILLATLSIILVLAVLSAFIPSGFNVERSIHIQAPAEKVYGELVNLQHWKHWNPWQAMDPDMQLNYYGPEAGIGAMQEWKSREMGGGKLSIVAIDTNRNVIYSVNFDGFDPMQGSFELKEDEKGVLVYWTARGDMGNNPVKKYFGLMMDGVMGKDFEKGLENLKAWCEVN